MRKRDNPEAWNELLKSMSQGEWKKAKQIVKDNEFYPNERDEMWRNTWIVTTPSGDTLMFRTTRDVAKALLISPAAVTKVNKNGKKIKGYAITKIKGDKR